MQSPASGDYQPPADDEDENSDTDQGISVQLL
jgi:hypothetical protein